MIPTRSELHGGEESSEPGAPSRTDEFRAMFDRYGKPVLSFVYGLVGDRAQAEELTQETFIRAFRKIATRNRDAQISTWLFGIARNVVREAVRDRIRGRLQIGLDEPGLALEAEGARPDESVVAGELNRAIRRALQNLPEDHRVVFVLKVLHQMSYGDISEITGSSVGKLKTDLHRARRAMREQLRAFFDAGETGQGGEP